MTPRGRLPDYDPFSMERRERWAARVSIALWLVFVALVVGGIVASHINFKRALAAEARHFPSPEGRGDA